MQENILGDPGRTVQSCSPTDIHLVIFDYGAGQLAGGPVLEATVGQPGVGLALSDPRTASNGDLT